MTKINRKQKKPLSIWKRIVDIYEKNYAKIEGLIDNLDAHHTFLLAAGLAFNILLYIIPLILITIYLVNVFFKTDDLIVFIENTLVEFLPATDYYEDIIYKIISEVQHIADGSTLAGIIGVVILLWLSSTVISTLNTCLSTIFNITQPHYIFTKLKDIATTILLTFFILIYSVFMPIFNFLGNYINSIFPDLLSGLLGNLFVVISPFIISFIVYYFIYGIIPYNKQEKIPRRLVLNTTFIAMLLTEVSRNIFTIYISNFANYNRFYGAYAVIITLAVWLYYSSFLILFSAELAKFLWDKKAEKNPIEN